MSRNPKIEQILSDWFEADHCVPQLRSKKREARDAEIKEYLGKNPFTVDQVLDTLHSQYKDYRIERKNREKLSGAQQSKKP